MHVQTFVHVFQLTACVIAHIYIQRVLKKKKLKTCVCKHSYMHFELNI